MLPVPITDIASAKTNIDLFYEGIGAVPEMQRRLGQVHAWYCKKNGDQFIFGPSKFIGYSKISFPLYLKYYKKGLHGGESEPILNQFFDELTPGHNEYQKIESALKEFLARFGKTPMKNSRIYYSPQNNESSEKLQSLPSAVDVALAAYQALNKSQKRIFAKRTAKIKS